MNFPQEFDLVSLATVVLINTFLSFLVYSKDKTKASNKIFMLFSTILSLWLMAMFFSSLQIYGSLHTNLLIMRGCIFLAVPMLLLFYLLIRNLDKKFIRSDRVFIGVLIFATSIMVMSQTHLIFNYSQLSADGQIKPVGGDAVILFAFYVIGVTFLIIHSFIGKYIQADKITKRQILFITLGFFVFSIFTTSTLLIPVIISENSYNISLVNFYALFFILMTSVAILKYRLFEIRVLAAEFISGSVFLLSIIWSFFSVSWVDLLFRVLFVFLVGFAGLYTVRALKREIRQKNTLERVTDKLRVANRKLKNFNRQKTEFLSIASHQLKTPLSITSGQIELFQLGAYGELNRKAHEAISELKESNDKLAVIVNDFLDITKIEQGKMEFDFQTVDMVKVVEEVVGSMDNRAREKGLNIAIKSPNKPSTVIMDRKKIIQVIFNFLDNAIKYTEEGEILARIYTKSNKIYLEIKDKGAGFSEEDKSLFFQKFTRSSYAKKSKIPGTGLGLYVCKKIVQAHQGDVYARSEGNGKGATFGFFLPFNKGEVN